MQIAEERRRTFESQWLCLTMSFFHSCFFTFSVSLPRSHPLNRGTLSRDRRRSSRTMFACYYFIMASSSCFPAAPPIYPDLFFIFCLFLKGCASSFLRTCISALPQMIKTNFSCEIPPTVSPICGCIMRKRAPIRKLGECRTHSSFPWNFFIPPLYSNTTASRLCSLAPWPALNRWGMFGTTL